MAAPTQAEVNRVLLAYNRAKSAEGYAETIVMEAEQISGDDYRMNWSDEYTGDFIDVSER